MVPLKISEIYVPRGSCSRAPSVLGSTLGPSICDNKGLVFISCIDHVLPNSPELLYVSYGLYYRVDTPSM